jgi:hypothetical protein
LPLAEPEAGVLMAKLRRLALADGSLGIVTSPNLRCESESEQDFAALCALLRLGLPDREALHVARTMRAIREGAVTAKNARSDYWASTLASANEQVESQETEHV